MADSRARAKQIWDKCRRIMEDSEFAGEFAGTSVPLKVAVPLTQNKDPLQRSLLFSDACTLLAADDAAESLKTGAIVSLCMAQAVNQDVYFGIIAQELALKVTQVHLPDRLIGDGNKVMARPLGALGTTHHTMATVMNDNADRVMAVGFQLRAVGDELQKTAWTQIIMCLHKINSKPGTRVNEVRRLLDNARRDVSKNGLFTDRALQNICNHLAKSYISRKVIAHLVVNLHDMETSVHGKLIRIATSLEGKGLEGFEITVKHARLADYEELKSSKYAWDFDTLTRLTQKMKTLGPMGPYIGLIAPDEAIHFHTNNYKKLFSFAIGAARELGTIMAGYTVDPSRIDTLAEREGHNAVRNTRRSLVNKRA